MKRIISLSLLLILFNGCASSGPYTKGEKNSDGVVFNQGSNHGVRVGDRVRALAKTCSREDNPTSKTCGYKTIGMLKVSEVSDASSVLKMEDSFNTNGEFYLKKEYGN